MENTYKWSRWILVALAVVLVGLFFLPLSSVKGEFRIYEQELRSDEGWTIDPERHVSEKDYMDLSFYSLAKTATLAEQNAEDVLVVVSMFGGLCVLVLLFALLKLSLMTFIIDALALLLYLQLVSVMHINHIALLLNLRQFGIAYILYAPVMIAILAISIEMFVLRIIIRRRKKQTS